MARVPIFQDDFGDGNQDLPVLSGTGSVTETGGALVVSVPGGTNADWYTFGRAGKLPYVGLTTFPSSWIKIYYEFTIRSWSTSDTNYSDLIVALFQSDTVLWTLASNNGSNFSIFKNWGSSLANITTTLPRKFRFIWDRKLSTVTIQCLITAPDTWTDIVTGAAIDMAPVGLGFGLKNWNLLPALTAQYEDVSIYAEDGDKVLTDGAGAEDNLVASEGGDDFAQARLNGLANGIDTGLASSFEDQGQAGTAQTGGPQTGTAQVTTLLRTLPEGFEDSLAVRLGLVPAYRPTANDPEGHPYFLDTLGSPRLRTAFLYDATRDPWNDPATYALTGYARDGYYYENGVRPSPQMIGVSTAGSKLYVRTAGGGWKVFSPQPDWGASTPGTLCLCLPGGGIIVQRATVPIFCHYSPLGASWSYKAAASALGSTTSGCVFDATHVYACGSGYVDKFNGTVWSALTVGALAGSPDHIWAQAADVLWCCFGGGTGNLWYYTTAGGWVDRWSEIPAALGAYSLTAARDVWTYGSNVYVITYASSTAKCYLVRYNGTAWSMLGELGSGASGDYHNIWGTDDSHIWISGRNVNISVRFWNGSTLATQLMGPSTSGIVYAGHKLAGKGSLLVVGSFYTTTNVVYETADGSTWNAVTWPDSTPAIVFATMDGGAIIAPWRAETASADRSSRPDFPVQSLLVTSQSELVIFDLDNWPSSIKVWMRFRLGNASNFYLLGQIADSLRATRMLNGALLVGSQHNGTENGGLFGVDFKRTDTDFALLVRSDGWWNGTAGRNITNRNQTGNWVSQGTGFVLDSEYVHYVDAALDNGLASRERMWVSAGSEDQVRIVEVLANQPKFVYKPVGALVGSSDDLVSGLKVSFFDHAGWLWLAQGPYVFRAIADFQGGVVVMGANAGSPTERHPYVRLTHPTGYVVVLGFAQVNESIYAATNVGVYRINRFTMDAYLCYTVSGGFGGGRLNRPPNGELLGGERQWVAWVKGFTVNRSGVPIGYLAVATNESTFFSSLPTNGRGAVTIIRTYDDALIDQRIWTGISSGLTEDGSWFMMPFGT